jgi:hypothetical protein
VSDSCREQELQCHNDSPKDNVDNRQRECNTMHTQTHLQVIKEKYKFNMRQTSTTKAFKYVCKSNGKCLYFPSCVVLFFYGFSVALLILWFHPSDFRKGTSWRLVQNRCRWHVSPLYFWRSLLLVVIIVVNMKMLYVNV